jgi:hypothetical protein
LAAGQREYTATWWLLQDEISTQLGDDKMFLQGVDNQGRALAIIRVRNHVARKDMREVRKFCIYTMDHMVRQ